MLHCEREKGWCWGGARLGQWAKINFDVPYMEIVVSSQAVPVRALSTVIRDDFDGHISRCHRDYVARCETLRKCIHMYAFKWAYHRKSMQNVRQNHVCVCMKTTGTLSASIACEATRMICLDALLSRSGIVYYCSFTCQNRIHTPPPHAAVGTIKRSRTLSVLASVESSSSQDLAKPNGLPSQLRPQQKCCERGRIPRISGPINASLSTECCSPHHPQQ